MSDKTIFVIGAVSKDSINFMFKAPEVGEIVVAKNQHSELGGRGANTAVSSYRASRTKPSDGSNASAEGGDIDVRLIAGIPDEWHLSNFGKKLQANGIKPDLLKILEAQGDLEPDTCVSFMESESGRARQVASFGTSNKWTSEDFDSADKIYGKNKPDLVIVTMELPKAVVEQIIQTVHADGVDVLLFASPGETLGLQYYPKLKHLVCDESDARMVGYRPEEVNKDSWAKICDAFTRKGVENVVLKVGLDGAYYKNAEGKEGFASGYKTDRDNIDLTGSTTAFLGPYATNYVLDKDNWDLQAATELGNKAGALFAIDIGYVSAIPWKDELDVELEFLYTDIKEVGVEPPTSPKSQKGLSKRRRKNAENI